MPLSREEVEQIALETAEQIFKQLQVAQAIYVEPRSVVHGLTQSMNEELTASMWYRRRAEHAESRNDQDTAKLYEHIADEEGTHYWEFNKRLSNLSQSAPRVYMVDDIKVIVRYERPGVHEVTLEAPGGRSITDEEGRRIDNLLKEVVPGES